MSRKRVVGALAALALALTAVVAPHAAAPSQPTKHSTTVAWGCEWCGTLSNTPSSVR